VYRVLPFITITPQSQEIVKQACKRIFFHLSDTHKQANKQTNKQTLAPDTACTS